MSEPTNQQTTEVMERPVVHKPNLIKQYVPGKSFVDIGGLWGTYGEMVTHAALAGASETTIADIQPADSEWWGKFRERCAERGVSGVHELITDICDPGEVAKLPTWDFVHCSGIMYHVADLFGYVSNLIKVTGEYLLLSSVTMPERIENQHGVMEFAPDQAYLTPLLSEHHRKILVEYLGENRTASGIHYDAEFVKDSTPQTGPWWWLFTGEFMSRFVAMYGLDVIAEGPSPTGQGYSVLARVSG